MHPHNHGEQQGIARQRQNIWAGFKSLPKILPFIACYRPVRLMDLLPTGDEFLDFIIVKFRQIQMRPRRSFNPVSVIVRPAGHNEAAASVKLTG